MTLLDNKHLHHFFHNKEINEMYGAVAILTLANALISIFVPIFMYRSGFSVIDILLFFVMAACFFVMLSFPSALVISRLGVKHTMLLSMPLLILFYLGLTKLAPGSVLFYILPALASAHAALFNVAYHMNFVRHADRDETGSELAFLHIVTNVFNFLGPFLGGLLILFFGFGFTFVIGSILLLLSMVPLFLSPDVKERVSFSFKGMWKFIFSRRALHMNVSFTGYAIESIIGRLVWPVFLLLVLGSIELVGGIVSLTLLTSLLITYFIGRITDKMDKRRLIKAGTFLQFFAWLGRLFVYSPLTALSVDTYMHLSRTVLHIPWSAYFYDIARKKDCLEFIIAREIVFNVARIIVLPLLMLLIYHFATIGFTLCFLVAAAFSLGYMTMK